MGMLSEGLQRWNMDVTEYGQPEISWKGAAFNGSWVMWFQPSSDTIQRIHKAGVESSYKATRDLQHAIDSAGLNTAESYLLVANRTKSKADLLREAEDRMETMRDLLMQAQTIIRLYVPPIDSSEGARLPMQAEAVFKNITGFLG